MLYVEFSNVQKFALVLQVVSCNMGSILNEFLQIECRDVAQPHALLVLFF